MNSGPFLGRTNKSYDTSVTTGETPISTNTDGGRRRSSSLGLLPTQPMATPMSNSLSFNSPHDAAISQMDKKIRELRSSLNSDMPGSSDAMDGNNSSTRMRARLLQEDIYDPYDGQSIGRMVPGNFSEEEDDVWTHLMEIRNSQSEIAKLHAAMENAVENDRYKDQGEDMPIDAEEDVKAVKAAEFAKLSDRFNERKVALNGIMTKLESLSQAINNFHSSRAPVFRHVSSQQTVNRPVNSDAFLKESPSSMAKSFQ